MKTKMMILLLVLLAAALMLSGCGGGDQNKNNPTAGIEFAHPDYDKDFSTLRTPGSQEEAYDYRLFFLPGVDGLNQPYAGDTMPYYEDGVYYIYYLKEGGDSAPDAWLDRARRALDVPNEVVRSLSSFSTDPAVIYRWRDEMADLIEEAP